MARVSGGLAVGQSQEQLAVLHEQQQKQQRVGIQMGGGIKKGSHPFQDTAAMGDTAAYSMHSSISSLGDWETVKDADGDIYYWNKKSHETTWEKPFSRDVDRTPVLVNRTASPLGKASQLVKGPQESTIAYAASPLPLESGFVERCHGTIDGAQFDGGLDSRNVGNKRENIRVWVLDVLGKKWPVQTSTDDDVIGLRNKIMKYAWMEDAQASWAIHGASQPILRRKALDKWTGKVVTLTLEDGDGFEHIPTGSFIEDGTIIEPVYDDGAYITAALPSLSKAGIAVKSLFRNTPFEEFMKDL